MSDDDLLVATSNPDSFWDDPVVKRRLALLEEYSLNVLAAIQARDEHMFRFNMGGLIGIAGLLIDRDVLSDWTADPDGRGTLPEGEGGEGGEDPKE